MAPAASLAAAHRPAGSIAARTARPGASRRAWEWDWYGWIHSKLTPIKIILEPTGASGTLAPT